LYNENYIESLSLSKARIEKWHAEDKNEGVLASGLIKKEFDAAKDISRWACYQKAALEKLPQNIHRESKLYVKAVVPGRNEPCHCGSGKKHKKCCI
jgi:uncharacterized protein YchJ